MMLFYYRSVKVVLVMEDAAARTSVERTGLLIGLLAILSFSITLPATREAVAYLDSTFVGLGRVVCASTMAALVLLITRQRLPPRRYWQSLFLIGLTTAVGFSLLSAWALNRLPASHGAIVLGLVPLLTALFGAIRAGERPPTRFWVWCVLGSLAVLAFAVGRGAGQLQWEDLALLAAAVVAAFGYAEGGRLTAAVGGWQVLCWSLVFAGPLLLVPFAWVALEQGLPALSMAPPEAWLGFAYVSAISQFAGLFIWYRALSLGGIARVSQVQLLQPFLTIAASALLLAEIITPDALIAASFVVITIFFGRRAKTQPTTVPKVAAAKASYRPE